MVIETGEAAPPINLRIAVPVFLVMTTQGRGTFCDRRVTTTIQRSTL
jgi:hypothetical protein